MLVALQVKLISRRRMGLLMLVGKLQKGSLTRAQNKGKRILLINANLIILLLLLMWGLPWVRIKLKDTAL